jgi:phosphonate transport system substrate-binding protein
MSELVLGAVAYDPKVVTIWNGFRDWLGEQGLALDYVLFSQYERQVEEFVAGRIDVAWNSPLAWVRTRRLITAAGRDARPVAMRDTDCDLTSVVVTRADSPIHRVEDLSGRVVGTGAIDSPQATLIPLSFLRAAGLVAGTNLRVRRFDVGVGLHGDHVGGERDAARALMAGEVDAACLMDGNLLLFAREGILAPGAVRVLAQTPPYDHCILTAGPQADHALVNRLTELLLGMSYADPRVRHLLDLEGLKEWRPPRLSGYAQLERAVTETGFYDLEGRRGAPGNRP